MADEPVVQTDNTEVASETPASTQPAVEAPQSEEPKATPEVTSEAQAPSSEATKDKEAGSLLSKVEDSSEPSEQKEEVPEKYEAFAGDHLDETANTELASLAKEANLTQTQANVMAQGYNAAMQSLQTANQKSVEENHAAFNQDPGGKENALLAVKALDKMGIKDHFTAQGYDNDYTLIKALAGYGRMLSEDKVITGNEASPAGNTLYPNSPELY